MKQSKRESLLSEALIEIADALGEQSEQYHHLGAKVGALCVDQENLFEKLVQMDKTLSSVNEGVQRILKLVERDRERLTVLTARVDRLSPPNGKRM